MPNPKTPASTSKSREEDFPTGQAATLAVKHLINPAEEKLSEVSYLPVGAVHSLTMMQTYEEHLNTLLEQVVQCKLWYLKRQLKRQVAAKSMTLEDSNKALETAKAEIETEKIDLAKLFIHCFRHAYYQHSRGKEGKFVEALTMLADTDMQTRNPDMEDAFSRPSRAQ